jgi:UDP-2,3-diacylglucosamine pyrophosphatase LpxH
MKTKVNFAKNTPYQSISTKYLPATNTKGSRVKAFTSWGKKSLTLAWDHDLTAEDNHRKVAARLADICNWTDCAWFMGGNHDGHYVFVAVNQLIDREVLRDAAKGGE